MPQFYTTETKMKICTTPQEYRAYRESLLGTVAFVPTMGALHKGHIALIEAAKKQADHVVVSIFVNPTQFLKGEDLSTYPRRDEADKTVCARLGVDVLFMPQAPDIYGTDELRITAPLVRGFTLEGARRPGHFDGMLQVVLKLLNIVSPNYAIFGKKDAQQLLLVRDMVKALFLPVTIIAVDTVRDTDGLALSSRNVYLTPHERTQALAISASLKEAGKCIIKGERNVSRITQTMHDILSALDVEYVACVNVAFESIDTIEPKNSIILVAAKVGKTRLIDNLWV